MKFFIKILFLIAAIILSGCTVHKPQPVKKRISDNQLQNYNFEAVTSAGEAYFWYLQGTQGVNALTKRLDTNRVLYLGNKKQNVNIAQSFNLQERGFLLKDIDAGKYKVKFGAYQADIEKKGEKGNIVVSFFDQHGRYISKKELGYSTKYGKWEKREAITSLPKGTRIVQMNLLGKRESSKYDGPYFDNAYLYIGTKYKIKSKIKTIEKDWKISNVITFDNDTKLCYLQDKEVFSSANSKIAKYRLICKDITTDNILFQKEYSMPYYLFMNISMKDNWLIVHFRDKKKTVYIDINNNFKEHVKKGDTYMFDEKFYIQYPDKTASSKYLKIYLFDTDKLVGKIPINIRYNLMIDKESHKVIFYELANNDRNRILNNFEFQDIYIFDMKTLELKKFSLKSKKAKKYQSTLPFTYFIAKNQNGEKIFYQLSIQSKALDKFAIKIKNGFTKASDYLGTYNDFDLVINSEKPVYSIKGINLKTLKYTNFNINDEIEKIDFRSGFDYIFLKTEKGLVVPKKLFEKLRYAYSSSNYRFSICDTYKIVDDKLFCYQMMQPIQIADKKRHRAYGTQYLKLNKKSQPLRSLSNKLFILKTKRGTQRFKVVEAKINYKDETYKIIKDNIYIYENIKRKQIGNRRITVNHGIYATPNEKYIIDLVYIIHYDRKTKKKTYECKLYIFEIQTGKLKTINLPSSFQVSSLQIVLIKDEYILMRNDTSFISFKI